VAEVYGRTEERTGGAPFLGGFVELGRLDSVLEQLGREGPAVVDVTGRRVSARAGCWRRSVPGPAGAG
jgi:hypothetical protein